MSKKKKRDGHKTIKSIVIERLHDHGVTVVDTAFVKTLESFDKAHEGLRLNNKHFREFVGEMQLEIRAKNAEIALLEKEKARLKASLRNEIGIVKGMRRELKSHKQLAEIIEA